MKIKQSLLYTTILLSIIIFAINFGGCGPGYEDLPPADPSVAKTTMYFNFGGHPLYDTVGGGTDPCRYFDGQSSSAAQVIVEILIPSTSSPGGLENLYPPQVFVDGKDFNKDPDGIGVQVPQKGGYLTLITVIGYPNPNCCPGPPVGRPVYRTIWPYTETQVGFRLRYVLPQFQFCLYI